MHLFLVPGDEDALLGMPDIELLNILQINCNTMGTKKEEKGMSYNQRKKVISVGSEQCYTNTGIENDCEKKDNDTDSCTNTGNSANSNNRDT